MQELPRSGGATWSGRDPLCTCQVRASIHSFFHSVFWLTIQSKIINGGYVRSDPYGLKNLYLASYEYRTVGVLAVNK